MRVSDVSLLAKKIAVGIVITLVPLTIVAGSLWVTQRALSRGPVADHSKEVSRAN